MKQTLYSQTLSCKAKAQFLPVKKTCGLNNQVLSVFFNWPHLIKLILILVIVCVVLTLQRLLGILLTAQTTFTNYTKILFFFHWWSPKCPVVYFYSVNPTLCLGWSQAVRVGWPIVWRVSRGTVCREIRAIFLCQRDMPAVLLWAVLGHHTLQSRPGIPQASGQGRRWPTEDRSLSLVSKQIHTRFPWVSLCFMAYTITGMAELVFKCILVKKLKRSP